MAITMKNLNDRTSALEGKSSTTPITMKGLDDRLSNLEKTAKKWAVVTLTSSNTGKSFLIPEEYRGWNYCILNAGYKTIAGYEATITNGRVFKMIMTGSAKLAELNTTISGNYINVNFGERNYRDYSLQVLFYK
jgi:hypothetical protein